MDKFEYYKISRDSGQPNRCPILDYCQRRAYTIFFYNQFDEKYKSLSEAIKNEKFLVPDYMDKEIKFNGEAPIWSNGNSYGYFENMCPEVNLFDSENALSYFKSRASVSGK